MDGLPHHAQPAPACAVRLEPDRHDTLHPELDGWRANVGGPVALDCAAVAAPRLHGIDVLSWNVAIGLGRLGEVLERLRHGAWGEVGSRDDRPLVILLQEAYREDPSIPRQSSSALHGGAVAARQRHDIVRTALEHGLSLRYSPSMRNGAHPSDRGNAVLATVRLTGSRSYLLPYVRQRRVAVSALLDGHADLVFVSAHLDTHGRARSPDSEVTSRRFGAGRAAQAGALAAALAAGEASVVLGADLNSVLGMSDPAVRSLVAAGMHPARRVGAWRHTFHTPFKLLLDHVLYRCLAGHITHAEVIRIDEVEGDRSRGVFGSDHHPLLARFELRGG